MLWELKFFVAFALLADVSAAIQCFSCSVLAEVIVTSNQRVVVPSCNSFDGSSKFIIECPYSTMCLETVHTIYLLNGQERKTTTLGCAQQKFSQHVLRGRVWKEEHIIKEIYPEGCVPQTDNDMAAAIRTYCYCRGNLCNNASQIISSGLPLLLTVVYILKEV